MIHDQVQPPDTFYVTTPIYYANSAPHLGSLYTTIIADTLARFHKQKGSETYFLTGTDEHGVNIERRAVERGLAPQQYVDDVVRQFKESFATFGVDTEHGGYDIFMRTTAAFHYQGVGQLWRKVRAARTPKGNEPIYKNFYEGWFCAACAAFKTEDEYSKPENDEDAPRCLVHLTALDRVAEESYFFRLSDYAETLIELYETKPSMIQPEARRNEVLSFLRSGLQDLSISRLVTSNGWGIPVPDDPTHTIYVWFDALSNYITAIGYGNEEREAVAGFEKYWRHVTHLVGKDILRFHTVYWHSFLLAANLRLPEVVYAHGMLLDRDGRKMGKTLGNTIELDILHKHFTNDAIRYFCLREVVFGADGRVGYEAMIDRTNSDLASGLGNLAARTLTMINRYCGGIIPTAELKEADYIHARRAGVQPDALELVSTLELARDQYVQLFESYQFSRALEVAWSVIARVDKFISDAKPWELAKDEAQHQTLGVVLYRAAETLRWLAVLLAPVMPDATDALWRQLGLHNDADSTTHAHHTNPRSLKWNGLPEGTKINASEGIFPRLDKIKIMNDIETNITQTQTAATPTEATPTIAAEKTASPSATPADTLPEGVASFITIDDFIKVEMRVGQILTAERVPKADKLLRFTVDVGEPQPRQILAGIAEYYEPETLIGRRIAVVSNLAPRKLRGFESQGMVLAASVEGGRPVLATFTEDVPNGARLK